MNEGSKAKELLEGEARKLGGCLNIVVEKKVYLSEGSHLKKSWIRETLTLSMRADSRTKISHIF